MRPRAVHCTSVQKITLSKDPEKKSWESWEEIQNAQQSKTWGSAVSMSGFLRCTMYFYERPCPGVFCFILHCIVACRWVLVHLQRPRHNYSAFILRCLDLTTFFASWHTGTKVFVFRFSHQNNFLYSITRKLHALTSKTEEESMKGVVVFLSLSLETIYGFSFKL